MKEVDLAGDSSVKVVDGAARGTITANDRRPGRRRRPPAGPGAIPTALEQVFANLIGNAINYLDRTRPGRIEVFAVDPNGHAERIAQGSVVYAIRDNGLGIPDNYKGKIFTAFQRLHGDVAKGEGVGLALVRRMVERHGGRVWFESESGRGTTFFVALPSSDPGAGAEDDERDTPLISTEIQKGRAAECQPSR